MTRYKLSALLALALALIAPSAAAEQHGYYMTVHLGSTLMKDAGNSGSTLDFETEQKIGYGASFIMGYEWLSGFRAEGEFTYRKHELDKIDVGRTGGITNLRVGSADTDGDIETLAFMANGTLNYLTESRFSPFVLAGAGFVRYAANDVRALNVDIVNDHDWVFAYQVGGGFAYAISEIFDFEVTYKYLITEDPSLRDSAGRKFESEYASHSIMFGFRLLLE